jgi:hypothetical protein
MRSEKAIGRQSANANGANGVNGVTVNGATGPSEDDATVIVSRVNAAKEPNGNGAKAIARVKPDDVKAESVLNVNGPEVMPAVRIC